MDYVLNRALQQSPLTKQVILSYDINCQYSIHLLDCLKKGHPYLNQPLANILFAIGSFHLGAHVTDCFHQYSLHFMQGAGTIDGEILETLWVSQNKLASSTQAMSQAHRSEVLDDIMGDSDWKKVFGLCELPEYQLLSYVC
jgi:hypothetical protein